MSEEVNAVALENAKKEEREQGRDKRWLRRWNICKAILWWTFISWSWALPRACFLWLWNLPHLRILAVLWPIIGMGLTGYGAYEIYRPAGFITLGSLMILDALHASSRQRPKKRDDAK